MTTTLSPEALARATAVKLVEDIRAQLADLRPAIDPRTRRAVPYYTLVELYATGDAFAWPRPVMLAPESLRADIRRQPEALVVVEMLGAEGGPFVFLLTDLEAT